jgi:hypothetical protein
MPKSASAIAPTCAAGPLPNVAFFDRFRVELRKYAGGVHDLGAPLTPLPPSLPPGLADFLRSWDGVRLFQDTVVILPLAEQAALAEEGGRLLGEWQEGTLELGDDGRIRSRDDDDAAIVVGSTLELFLTVVMAREGLLVDREGEFKDVFDEEGIDERVRVKQTAAALKIDPEAAAWHLESAERAFGEGEDAAAEAALARAVALDEGAGDAWALLGALQRRAARLEAAAASFARAAAATPNAAARAERAAEAARAAAEGSHEGVRAAQAAVAVAADPSVVGRWLDEARELMSEGDGEGAFNRASLAAAVDPAASADILRQARVRAKLKTIG